MRMIDLSRVAKFFSRKRISFCAGGGVDFTRAIRGVVTLGFDELAVGGDHEVDFLAGLVLHLRFIDGAASDLLILEVNGTRLTALGDDGFPHGFGHL